MTSNAMTPRHLRLSLYADRAAQRWVVRDSEGQFWSFPLADSSWDEREPIDVTDDVSLEPVPGHYLVLLGLTSASLR